MSWLTTLTAEPYLQSSLNDTFRVVLQNGVELLPTTTVSATRELIRDESDENGRANQERLLYEEMEQSCIHQMVSRMTHIPKKLSEKVCMSWSSLLAQKLRPDENGNLPRLWFYWARNPAGHRAQDAIRAAAFKAGYSERKSFVFEATPITRLFTSTRRSEPFRRKKSD